jgi:uncharacterized protein involved in copper resistance
MRKRFLSIVFVVVALLFSAWGNVIAAAFCPRFALNHDCCLKHGTQPSKQANHESSCHHEMAGMEMDDMQMETEADSAPDTSAQNSHAQRPSESSSDEVALDLPIEQCACCLSHSQTISGTVSVVAIDPSKRLVETNSPPANFAIGLTSAFAGLIVSSEHSPPGPSTPRHVIINVFRI